MMKKITLAIGCSLLMGGSVVAAPMNEPIQPIQPAKVKNPAMVELGKKNCFLMFACRVLVSFPVIPVTTCRWVGQTT